MIEAVLVGRPLADFERNAAGSGEEQRMNGMTKAGVKWEELIWEVRGSSYALQ
ncbi:MULTISPECIES: hypothetical protein [unclassified Cohnella]|uniref:hypothetical protein n=1 Tax=unclassified Cohnella TaxID=2636738 RepID=UPI0013041831|nr:MULTISPECIES: hypothetical protein [unclassified Cohnella]